MTTAGPVRDIAAFAAALRSRGLTVTPDQMSDMASALGLIDPAARRQVHAAFRCLAITDPGQRFAFDQEFNRFFDRLMDSVNLDREPQRALTSGISPVVETIGEEGLEDAISQEGASAIENVAERDFAELDDNQLEEARRLVLTMMWQPSESRTRRWVHDRPGTRPDMRRTLRTAVGPEGDLMRIERQRRRTQQRPLIVIADISGSMERYAELFLVFSHAALHKMRHVEVFTFSTQLTRITEDLRRANARIALDRAGRTVQDWSGGTKIGEALETWNRAWSRRLARGGPVVLILSDGWDCGDPSLLSTEMARLSRSVHKVIWLNPLAARAGYEPATRGMKAVLPHIDHLLPAASVQHLRGVVRLLEEIDRPGAA